MSLTVVSKKITKAKGPSILAADIVKKLSERCPGLNFDQGGRLDLWHPKIDRFQGVFYYHKHICSMDRGVCPMFPVYNAKSELTRVEVFDALKEDIPLLSLAPDGGHEAQESKYGFAIRPRVQSVDKIGWAQMFYKLLVAEVPGITKEWLATTFQVPMGWYTKGDPPQNSREADKLATEGVMEEWAV